VSEPCEKCKKSLAICVCDRAVPLESRTRVVVLQHPQEQDVELSSTPLVLASLPRSQKVVGLSWPSLAKALGEPVESRDWAVIYPTPPKGAPEPEPPATAYGPKGAVIDPRELRNLVVLDGSWSQTKTLWWRNAWLLKLSRLVLVPSEPSIYGRLRKEPKKTSLSTLEAVADALVAIGEPEANRDILRRLFRTMVQRARDAGIKGAAGR
jgi:DTW domain-containing protein